MEQKTPAVYAAIAGVQAAIAKVGIAKARKNQQQNYAFRGIDDVYSALSPLLAEHGLCIVPRVISRTCTERQTQRGGALFYTAVQVEYTIAAVKDGSTVTACIFGEAMDSGDKSTNKALSAAYKYLCLQLFCIPTEGDNDADGTSHEVKAERKYDLNRGLSRIAAATDSTILTVIGKDELAAAPKECHAALIEAGKKRRAELDAQ